MCRHMVAAADDARARPSPRVSRSGAELSTPRTPQHAPRGRVQLIVTRPPDFTDEFLDRAPRRSRSRAGAAPVEASAQMKGRASRCST